MRRSLITIAGLGLVLAMSLPTASVKAGSAGEAGLAAQDDKKAEADAYKAWYDVRNDLRKGIELAEKYLGDFPRGQYADYLKKWIVGARGGLFNQAMQSRDTAEMIRLGRIALAEDSDNLDYLYLLAISIRQNELFAAPPNFLHAAEAADFSRRSIRLIEAGKVPGVFDSSKWKQDIQLSLLYQNLAVIEARNKNREKALEYYRKASQLDPSNAYNFLACGSIHQQNYQDAVVKFQAIPEVDREDPEAKPEVKAALDTVNREADAVIECWVRFMALTSAKNEFGTARDQVHKALTELYNYRHPDSPEGLQKLIDQQRTPGESATTTTSAPPAKP